MTPEHFTDLMQPILKACSNTAIDATLEDALNASFPPSSATFRNIEKACHDAIAAGWMCSQGGAGRRFGRVIEAGGATAGLSVDVVDLENIVGVIREVLENEDRTARIIGEAESVLANLDWEQSSRQLVAEFGRIVSP